MIGNIVDPITKERYTRDPRNIAQKAESLPPVHGHRRHGYFGSEAEFFIFDDIRFDQNEHCSYYYIDSVEGRVEHRTRGEAQPRLQAAIQGRLFPGAPHDALPGPAQRDGPEHGGCGLHVEAHHHEVATAGQMEIDIKYAP